MKYDEMLDAATNKIEIMKVNYIMEFVLEFDYTWSRSLKFVTL